MMLTAREIADRLEEVRGRIADVIRQARRESDSVQLVLASKTQPAAAVRAAFAAGARDFGENWVQEAVSKRSVLPDLAIRWHLIGHLQTNKVRAAIKTFDVIQTLDSQRLATTLFRLRPLRPMPVLLEINLAGEISKSGIEPEGAEVLINSVRDQVDVRGLMTIPPMTGSAQEAGQFFRQLRELRDRLVAATGLRLSELSMGMTDDFEAAILEGATIVRVGRAVFGER